MTPPQTFETFNDQQYRCAKAKGKRVAMPPAAYGLHVDDEGPYFQVRKLTTDDLIHSDDPREVALRREVQTFFASGDLYAKHGFTHRRGVLLHGPAGSGKSCLLRSFCQEHIANGGHVFLVDHSDEPAFIFHMLGLLQDRNEDAKVIVVIEEVEEYVERRGEHGLLSMMDGERSLQGALIVATTNYPEKLNKRIVNRPRRFDRVLGIGMPGGAVRREYFQKKLHIEEAELDLWVESSKGFSFAAMADLVISNKCLGIPLEQAAKDILAMLGSSPNSADEIPPAPEPPKPMTPKPLMTLDDAFNAVLGRPTPPSPHPFLAPIIERIEESAQCTSGGCD